MRCEGFERDGFGDAFLEGCLEVRECWVQENQGWVGVSDRVEELFDWVGGAFDFEVRVYRWVIKAQWLFMGSRVIVIVQGVV